MKEKHYLEIIEQLTLDESLEKLPRIVRLEVADETEARKLLPKYEPAFAGLKYVKRVHIHRHAAGGHGACRVAPL